MERYMRDTFFFARIMKEHGLVPEAGFVCADRAWREKADWFRQQFEEITSGCGESGEWESILREVMA